MDSLFRDVAGDCISPAGSVVCIGAFDGLHLGHQALIGHARARARSLGLPLIALSFEPLPREFFLPSPPSRLLLPRMKYQGLRELGCDSAGLLRFNRDMTQMSAEEFVQRVLVQRVNAKEVWVGPEFRFGHARRGDIALLQAMGLELGFVANEIPLQKFSGERVSSSLIREYLAQGDMQHAAKALGHRYSIAGKVVRGKQLGRTLGYPTANLRLQGKKPALMGIFATWVHGVGSKPHASVSSLGTRPTVNGVEPLLEAHLFGFDGDLYGQRIEVEFVAKLRNEEKFDGLDALVKQMHLDAEQARDILQNDSLKKEVAA